MGAIKYVEAITLGIINILALAGNLSLYYVVLRKQSMRTRTNWFILNLAAADLLVSVINMPLTIATVVYEDWVFGDLVCTMTGFTNILSFIGSVMSLAMISIARYHKVVIWKSYSRFFTSRRCYAYIASVWLISISLAIPPLIGWAEYSYIPGKSYCFVNWPRSISYTFFMIAICLFGPLTTMVFCYWKIWKTTKASQQNMSAHQVGNVRQLQENRLQLTDLNQAKGETRSMTRGMRCSESNSNIPVLTRAIVLDQFDNRSSLSDMVPETESSTAHTPEIKSKSRGILKALKIRTKHDMKLTRTLIIVVVVFAICWTPFAITMVVEVFNSHAIPRGVDFGTLLLGYANSACNVIIYIGTSRQFRQAFKEAFGIGKLPSVFCCRNT